MISPAYSVRTELGFLAITWGEKNPFASLGSLYVLFFLLGLILLFFHKKIGAAIREYFMVKIRIERIFVIFGILMLLLGGGLFYITKHGPPVTKWIFTTNDILVQIDQEKTHFDWANVQEVRLSQKGRKIGQSDLVLKNKEGKEIWLVMKWLIKSNRLQVLKFLKKQSPEKMAPIFENKAYLESLQNAKPIEDS